MPPTSPPPKVEQYKIGDILWVQLEGYPWWPARVFIPTAKELGDLGVKSIPTEKVAVRFFNDGNRYSLVALTSVRRFETDITRDRLSGKFAKLWKGAVDEAWHYIMNRDPGDHPDARPRPEDVPSRRNVPSASGTRNKRSSKSAETERRPKKRKRPSNSSTAAAASATNANSSNNKNSSTNNDDNNVPPPASTNDSPPSSALKVTANSIAANTTTVPPEGESEDDHLEIPPQKQQPEKEKVKKRTRKSDAPNSSTRAKKDSARTSTASDRGDHSKPQRKRKAAILLNDTVSADDADVGNDRGPLKKTTSRHASVPPPSPPPPSPPAESRAKQKHIKQQRHNSAQPISPTAADLALADSGRDAHLPVSKSGGPSPAIKPQKVKEFSQNDDAVIGSSASPRHVVKSRNDDFDAQPQRAPSPTSSPAAAAGNKQALDGEQVGERENVPRRASPENDDGDNYAHSPRTPNRTPDSLRAASPVRSPSDQDRERSPVDHPATNLTVEEAEQQRKYEKEFMEQSENYQYKAYEGFSRETCIKLLIAKDRALRDSNIKLWTVRYTHCKIEKLHTQESFDDLCEKIIEAGSDFINAANAEGVQEKRSDEVKKLENRAHSVARQLENAFFETSKVDITASGDLLMEFVERVAPLSAKVGVLVRDMVILWLDLMSLPDAKLKRHPRTLKKSKHKKAGKVASAEHLDEIAENGASPQDDGIHSQREDEWSPRPSPRKEERSPSVHSDDSRPRVGRTRRRDVEDGNNYPFGMDVEEGHQNADYSRKRSRGLSRRDEQPDDDRERRSGDSGARDEHQNRLDNNVGSDDDIERSKYQNSVDADLKSVDPKAANTYNDNSSRSPSRSPAHRHHSPMRSLSPAKSEAERDDTPEGQAIETNDARPLRQAIEEGGPDDRKQGRGAQQEVDDGSEEEVQDRQLRAPKSSVLSSVRQDEAAGTGMERKPELASSGTGARDNKNKKNFNKEVCKQKIDEILSTIRKETTGMKKFKKSDRMKLTTDMAEELCRYAGVDGLYDAYITLMRCLQQVTRESNDLSDNEKSTRSPLMTAFRSLVSDSSTVKEFIAICLQERVVTSNT